MSIYFFTRCNFSFKSLFHALFQPLVYSCRKFMEYKFCKQCWKDFYFSLYAIPTILRIHLFACAWGSMKRGHRLEFITRTAFSMNRVSLGKPFICQFLISIWLPSVNIGLQSRVWGTSSPRASYQVAKRFWR